MIHPFFSLALHRASVIALHKGEITEEQAGVVSSIILHPNRESATGEHADVVELARQKTVTMAQGTGMTAIDLSALANGVYMINVKSATLNYNSKIEVVK